MDPFDRVCQKLGAQPRGNQAMARCPAHEDRQASLSVSRGDKGVVLHCHAGCDTRAIAEALGLRMSDLFDEAPAPRERAEIVATYNYVDEMGELLYRVIRYSDKRFQQRAASGAWSVKGIRKVPYRLPEVLDAIRRSETIWIAEGEKDVDALWRAGAPATCNSGGAGKWTAEHAQTIAGAAEVVIVADKDAAGIAHAQSVRQSLGAVGITETTIVQAAIGKDAADHLGAGKALDEFVPLQEAGEGDDAPSGPRPIVWADFWADDQGESEWLCEPFLPRGRLTTMVSAAKSGKSLLTLEVAAKLAIGDAVLERPAGDPMNVVYFDFEMTDMDLRERMVDMGFGPGDDLSHFHYYLLPSLPPADSPEGGKAVLDICRAHEAELVVIDTMARVVNGEENSNDTYRAFYQWTAMHLKAEGMTVLLIDHLGKDASRGARGGSDKVGQVDLVWQLTAAEGGILTLKRTFTRVGWVQEAFTVKRNEFPLLSHSIENVDVYPAGTAELVARMKTLGITPAISARKAQKTLTEAGNGRRMADITAALKWMRAEVPTFQKPRTTSMKADESVSRKHSETDSSEEIGKRSGNSVLTSTGNGWETPETPSPAYPTPFPPSRRETVGAQIETNESLNNVDKAFDPLEFF